MAFKMKGSPHKMGGIKGTSGHTSALKQHAEASALKQAEASALKEGTDWWDKVKSAGSAVWDNLGKVNPVGHSLTEKIAYDYGEKKKEYRKAAKDKDKKSSNKMKSPMEQKKKLNLETIKEGFEGTDTEKVVKAVKNVAGKVKKFRKSLKPTSETTVKSERTEGKRKGYRGKDVVTATTKKKKKKLFGGSKETVSSSSQEYDVLAEKDGPGRSRAVKEEGTRKQGTTTTTHTRNKRRGGGKKKEVTINQNTGEKTVTRYKKDGSVKSTKVKKGDYSTSSTPSNRYALRNEDKKNTQTESAKMKEAYAESKKK
jgi:hypothetical protein